MLHRRRVVMAVVAVWSLWPAVVAASYDATIERNQLVLALETYTACNLSCAEQLAAIVVDQSVEQGLDLLASLEALGSAKNKKLKAALFYALIRRTSQRGEKIMSSHGACANQCDKLSADVVTLARAGLLGPMLRNGRIDPGAFENPRVLEVYQKYVRPVPADKLPWNFHNQGWWAKVERTA